MRGIALRRNRRHLQAARARKTIDELRARTGKLERRLDRLDRMKFTPSAQF